MRWGAGDAGGCPGGAGIELIFLHFIKFMGLGLMA